MAASFDGNGKLIMGKQSTMNDQWQMNLYKLLSRGGNIQPNSQILTVTDNGMHSMTYQQLNIAASTLASSLKHRLGVNIGDCCGSFMYNTSRHMTLYYAIPCMGAILNTINIRLHPKELSYLIQHAQNKAIFVDYNLLPSFTQIPINAFKSVKYIIVCGQNELPLTKNQSKNLKKSSFFVQLLQHSNTKYIEYDELMMKINELPPFIWPNLDERSGCFLCYTSGTTGNPKGVLFSHRSLFIHILSDLSTDHLNISGIDILCPIVPLYHALGWLFPFSAMCLGYKLILLNECNTYDRILPICASQKVSIIAGVPTVIQSFKNGILSQNANDEYTNYLKYTLKRALCGGGKCNHSMIGWFWSEYGIELITNWGMTETSGPGTTARMKMTQFDLENESEKNLENLYNVGLAPSTLELKVEENENGMGELLAFGPYVTRKYYKVSEEETADKFDENGWLRTGDIVQFTERKQLIIKDRSKDVIKSGGEWISSIDMENYVMSFDVKNILKCVVLSIPHDKYDERPIVILESKRRFEMKQIMDHLKKKYANFQLPDDILYWDHIPVAGTGKISKKEIRELLKKHKYKLPDVPLRKMLYQQTSKL